MRLFSPHDDNMPPMELRGMETLVFSDGVQKIDIRQFYRAEPPGVCGEWSEVLSRLKEKYHGKNPLVAIYPMGAIQIGEL
ncbi:hypothetical protein SDC9_81301 [bioreactor metagenome]|uniref:Uncharacterized protein n=1 Tax=bioreactor metagenome TaxID=1076179 RepID=A0A644ZA07_9ZZZZ